MGEDSLSNAAGGRAGDSITGLKIGGLRRLSSSDSGVVSSSVSKCVTSELAESRELFRVDSGVG